MVDAARGRSRAFPRSERRVCGALPQLPRVPRAVTVGALPSGPKQGEASCAGLAPEAVYVYGERGEGRTNRPPCTGSTVAPTVTAHWKANQHEVTTAHRRSNVTPMRRRSLARSASLAHRENQTSALRAGSEEASLPQNRSARQVPAAENEPPRLALPTRVRQK